VTGPVGAVALSCADLHLHFGGVAALTDINLQVTTGEVVGLIGPNGAGKSSLINVLTGFYVPQQGRVELLGRETTGLKPRRVALMGVSRTFQQAEGLSGMGAADVMLLGRDRFQPPGFVRYAVGWPPTRRAERQARDVVTAIADELGVGDVVRRNTAYESLPYGVRKLVDLGRAVACEPRVLLMDEPAAGLTDEEKSVMTDVIRGLGTSRELTQVLVDHDLGFVSALCPRLIVLDAGRLIAEGATADVLAEPHVIDSYIGRPDDTEVPA
jgi:branched-chain amino acid transport system ATP-binding protein